jgi:hypothetical protein
VNYRVTRPLRKTIASAAPTLPPFFQRLLQQIGNVQSGCPLLQVGEIQSLSLDFDDAQYVPPMAFRDFPTQPKPVQLGQNNVLGGPDPECLGGIRTDGLGNPAGELLPVKRPVPGQEHVDLDHGLKVDEAEVAAPLERLAD